MSGPSLGPLFLPMLGKKPTQPLLLQTAVCFAGIDASTHSFITLAFRDKTLALPGEAG